MANTQRRTDPDPVGVAMLGILLVLVLLAALLCSFTPADDDDVLFDLVGLGFALFCFVCLRWAWKAMRHWRHIHDNWKPPHHP